MILKKIPLTQIDVSELNVRQANLEEGIDELAKNIEEIGLQQPVVVYRVGNKYKLIIGQRRYLACRKLRWEKIDAVITTVKNKKEAIIKSLTDNIHRLDLEYRDKNRAAAELLSELGTIAKVAKAIGVTYQTVRNWLGYSAVPEKMKKMVDEGKLSASTATLITQGIPDEDQAIKIAEKIIYDVPRSEDRVKVINIAKERPDKSPEEIVKAMQEEKLTKVTIFLTTKRAEAVERACSEYSTYDDNVTPEAIASEALDEWLSKRGFLK